MLSLAYKATDLWDSQRRSAWEKEGREHLRSLYGHTVGIVGLGHIGQALARGLINARTLAMMKPSARLINIARGGVVDEPDLIDALRHGKIAGAGLDVFCQEPLPSDSPLWTMPNVLITPHTSAREPDRDERAVALISENIRRYRMGQTLLNEVSDGDLYTP